MYTGFLSSFYVELHTGFLPTLYIHAEVYTECLPFMPGWHGGLMR